MRFPEQYSQAEGVDKTSKVYRVLEVHRILRSFAWQFCMAVLHHIVNYSIHMKTSEVWRVAFSLYPHQAPGAGIGNPWLKLRSAIRHWDSEMEKLVLCQGVARGGAEIPCMDFLPE